MQPQAILDGLMTVDRPTGGKSVLFALFSDERRDIVQVRRFLAAYTGSVDTFRAYRRDMERLLLWLWSVQKTTLVAMGRHDLLAFMRFLQKPPANWIGTHNCPRFDDESATRPHEHWRPFVDRSGRLSRYGLAAGSLRAMMNTVSTCLTYLVQEGYLQQNAMQMLRQKSQFLQKEQQMRITRKLSAKQWQCLIAYAEYLAAKDPLYERHLFILSCFFLLGVRISELSVTDKHAPKMRHFIRDEADRFWFAVVGKGNKYREIAVSDSMLMALVRYRRSMGLADYPSRHDEHDLLPKLKGRGGLGSRQIRYLVQRLFDGAAEWLLKKGKAEDAEALHAATVHWLRHTAISFDVQHRPLEDVREDAGHANLTITDRYIDSERHKRHQSAKGKSLLPEEGDRYD